MGDPKTIQDIQVGNLDIFGWGPEIWWNGGPSELVQKHSLVTKVRLSPHNDQIIGCLVHAL